MQEAAFDLGAEVNGFARDHNSAGAIVSFTGIVRDLPEAQLDRMVIEHYPGMSEAALSKIHDQACNCWSLSGALVIHRYGDLQPGEYIMMVATAARHRTAAFEAAEFLMDYLKSRAPFWKKEFTRDGAEWVDSKAADEAALDRWRD